MSSDLPDLSMPLKKEPLKEIFVGLLYVLITFFFFDKIFTRVYIDLGDGWSQFYGRCAFFKEQLPHGFFLWWDPLVLCGIPSGVDAVSNFSLRHFLLSFMSLNRAWNAQQFLTTALTGWLQYVILKKQVGLSRPAAFFGGLVLLATTINLAPDNPAYFLFPAMFFFAHAWIENRRFVDNLCLSFALALYFLNANAHYVLYAALFVWGYLVFRILTSPKKEERHELLVKSSWPFIVATGLCAFQILRVSEILSLSYRSEAVKNMIHMLAPHSYIGVLFPRFYESSLHSAPNLAPELLFRTATTKFLGLGEWSFIWPPYAGIAPFLFAVVMFFKKQKSALEKFLTGAALGILGYLLFNPVLFFGIRYIPFLSQLPAIGRLGNQWVFCVSFLAALCFDSLRQGGFSSQFNWKPVRKILTLLLSLYAVVFIFQISSSLFFRFAGQSLPSFLDQKMLPWILSLPFLKVSPEFCQMRLLQLARFFRDWGSLQNLNLLIPALLGTMVVVLLKRFLAQRIPFRLFVFFLFFLTLADLKVNMPASPSLAPSELRPYETEAAYLSRQTGLFRVISLQQEKAEFAPDARSLLLSPETTQTYGLATPEGYRSLIPKRYGEFIGLLSGEQPRRWLIGEFARVNDAYAALMNIKYVFAEKDRPMEKEYTKVYENGRNAIYRNPNALERAFIVHKIRNYHQGGQVLAALKMRTPDFSSEALVEDPKTPEGDSVAGAPSIYDRATVVEYDSHRVEIDTLTASEGFLILSDSYFPGWKASVDGQETLLYPANYVFRGISLPKGHHRVTFSYTPTSLKRGLGISGLFLALSIALFFRYRKKKF